MQLLRDGHVAHFGGAVLKLASGKPKGEAFFINDQRRGCVEFRWRSYIHIPKV